jgi:hypothetical protein
MILPTSPPTTKMLISLIVFRKALLASQGFVSGGVVSSLSDTVSFVSSRRCIMILPRYEHIFDIL